METPDVHYDVAETVIENREVPTVHDEAAGGAIENMVAPDLEDEAVMEHLDAPDCSPGFGSRPENRVHRHPGASGPGLDERLTNLVSPVAVLSAGDRDMLKENIIALLGA